MGAKVSASGGKGKRNSYGANADMNVIPFIDILLVLLIIFMVAAPIPTVDVKVDLPPPIPPPTIVEEPKKPTIVDVRDNGGQAQIFVDGTVTDESNLAALTLARVSVNVPDSPNRLLESVRVRADQTLPYGEVMGVMTELQGANFQAVSLVAETAIPASEVGQ